MFGQYWPNLVTLAFCTIKYPSEITMPLSAKFTEQVETIPCAHASCRKLVPRFQLQEVIGEENGMVSRFVCPACYKYYDRKTAASMPFIHSL